MFTLRARIFIITSVIVLLILGISIGLLLFSRSRQAPASPPAAPIVDTTSGATNTLPIITAPLKTEVQDTVPTGIPVKERTPTEVTQGAVKQFAKIFIERYTTYSTDSNFQNIRDVEELVTPRLWSILSAKLATPPASTAFTGVTTQAIMVTLLDWQDTAATLEIKTRQVTTKGASASATTYVTYKVRLEKQANAWLVDSVEVVP